MGIQLNGNNDNISAVDGDLSITGISTFSQLDVGNNIKLGNAGVLTATSFSGSGANLTGISGGVDSDSSNNTLGGTNAGDSITSATDCTFFGKDAGTDITDGQYNTFIGSLAGSNTNSGTYLNTFVGYNAGVNNGNGNHNVFIGANTGNQNAAWDNVFIGNYSGDANTSGTQNVFVGKNSGTTNTQSSYNVAIGFESLKNFNRSDAGGQNTAVGWKSGDAMTVGRYNSLLGTDSGGGITDGEQNSCLGYAAGRSITSGSTNTCIGYGAGKDSIETGNNNTIIGNDAESSSTSVSNEITLGDANITKFRIPGLNFDIDSGGVVNSGKLRIDISNGGGAGSGTAEGIFLRNLQETDNNCISIFGGADSYSAAASAINFINVDHSANAGNISFDTRSTSNVYAERMRITTNANGSSALYVNQTSEVSGANSHIVVNNSIACVSGSNFRSMYMSGAGVLHFWNGSNQPYITTGGSFTNASDVSLKKDITDLTYGIDVLKNLKPRKYKMKSDDKEQIGFIAQEVETAVPEVVDTSETPDGTEQKGLSYGNLTAVLTKALQEAIAKIETLEAKVGTLEQDNTLLKNKVLENVVRIVNLENDSHEH